MWDLLIGSLEVAWYSLLAGLIGRKTMRANWKKMYRMHSTVLDRMQHIEGLIIRNALGSKVRSRHVASTHKTVGVSPISTALCLHSDTPIDAGPIRHASDPSNDLKIFRHRVRPLTAGLIAAVVIFLAIFR